MDMFGAFMAGLSSGGVVPATLSFTASDGDSVDRTTYTFSSKSLGTAAGDRLVAVVVGGDRSTVTVSSLTVGGVSAALVSDGTTSARQQGGGMTVEMWIAAVPTGTAGDVVVTWSAGQGRCAIGVYALYGAAGTAHQVENNAGGSVASLSVTPDVPSGGVVIAGAIMSQAGGPFAMSWTAGVTEDMDQNPESDMATGSGSAEVPNGESGRTITVAPGGSGGNTVNLVSASFGP